MSLKRTALFALPFVLCVALPACDDPPSGTAPAASSAAPAKTAAATAAATATAASTAAATAAPAAGGGLAIDTAASSVGFVGAKITGKHEGKFAKFSGTVTLAGGKAEGGKVVVEIDLDSLKTDSEKLDGHLKAPDFFDVAKFPKATFTSTEIKAGGEKGATHTVSGELDLHGTKKTISFPATVQVGADEASATAELTINRKDYGIAYAGMKDDLIKDDVQIKLSIKARKAK